MSCTCTRHKPPCARVFDILRCPPCLLYNCEDPELAEVFASNNLEPFFALSWLLTWFAHDVTNLEEAARLFDLMLASPPIMPLYVAVVVLTGARSALLDADVRDDYSLLHSTAAKLHVFGSYGADEVARRSLAMMKEWSVVEVERRTGYILPRSCAQARYPFPWMAAGDEDVQEAASRGGVALVLGIIVLGFAMIAGDEVVEMIVTSLT